LLLIDGLNHEHALIFASIAVLRQACIVTALTVKIPMNAPQ
jgi:hypothetical protein